MDGKEAKLINGSDLRALPNAPIVVKGLIRLGRPWAGLVQDAELVRHQIGYADCRAERGRRSRGTVKEELQLVGAA